MAARRPPLMPAGGPLLFFGVAASFVESGGGPLALIDMAGGGGPLGPLPPLPIQQPPNIGSGSMPADIIF